MGPRASTVGAACSTPGRRGHRLKPVFGIGGAEWLILMVAGLFIRGPERLPSAATWLARTMKQVQQYATGAHEQLTRRPP